MSGEPINFHDIHGMSAASEDSTQKQEYLRKKREQAKKPVKKKRTEGDNVELELSEEARNYLRRLEDEEDRLNDYLDQF